MQAGLERATLSGAGLPRNIRQEGCGCFPEHCGALAALPLCNGIEVVAVCRANLVLSATLRPCGILRDGALHAAAVQPNREPALSRLFLARLARAANNPTRLGSPMQVRPMPRAPQGDEPHLAPPHKHKITQVCNPMSMFTEPAGYRSPNVDLPRSRRSMSIASPSRPWIFTRGWPGSLSSRAS